MTKKLYTYHILALVIVCLFGLEAYLGYQAGIEDQRIRFLACDSTQTTNKFVVLNNFQNGGTTADVNILQVPLNLGKRIINHSNEKIRLSQINCEI